MSYHDLVAKNNRNAFSSSSGDQWSEIKMLEGLTPCGGSEGEHFLVSSGVLVGL